VAQLLGVSTVLFALVAAVPQFGQPLLQVTTSKSVDAFGACFAATQGLAGHAWAYMPIGQGGTFTDAGAMGSAGSYWLKVDGSDHRGKIRLFGDGGRLASRSLIEAVDQCR
jgi:hypothetical protein